MSRTYVVKQGDSLGRIAHAHGFASHQALYDHAANAELKRRRPDPSLLEPGDLVAIPEAIPREVSRPTGQWHEETVDIEKPILRLKLLDLQHKPLAQQDYELAFGGETRHGTTNGEGILEEPVDYGVRQALLKTTVTQGDEPRALTWNLELDSVDPKGTVTGLQQRLRNLGYYNGELDGCLGPATRAAVGTFQGHQGLEPTGIADDATWNELERLHDESA